MNYPLRSYHGTSPLAAQYIVRDFEVLPPVLETKPCSNPFYPREAKRVRERPDIIGKHGPRNPYPTWLYFSDCFALSYGLLQSQNVCLVECAFPPGTFDGKYPRGKADTLWYYLNYNPSMTWGEYHSTDTLPRIGSSVVDQRKLTWQDSYESMRSFAVDCDGLSEGVTPVRIAYIDREKLDLATLLQWTEIQPRTCYDTGTLGELTEIHRNIFDEPGSGVRVYDLWQLREALRWKRDYLYGRCEAEDIPVALRLTNGIPRSTGDNTVDGSALFAPSVPLDRNVKREVL